MKAYHIKDYIKSVDQAEHTAYQNYNSAGRSDPRQYRKLITMMHTLDNYDNSDVINVDDQGRYEVRRGSQEIGYGTFNVVV